MSAYFSKINRTVLSDHRYFESNKIRVGLNNFLRNPSSKISIIDFATIMSIKRVLISSPKPFNLMSINSNWIMWTSIIIGIILHKIDELILTIRNHRNHYLRQQAIIEKTQYIIIIIIRIPSYIVPSSIYLIEISPSTILSMVP